MSTAKMVLVVLFVLVALGTVGRMDYEDAKRMERASTEDAIRLFCVGFPIDASALRSPSKSGRGTALLVNTSQTADVEVPAPRVLRCVVMEE